MKNLSKIVLLLTAYLLPFQVAYASIGDSSDNFLHVEQKQKQNNKSAIDLLEKTLEEESKEGRSKNNEFSDGQDIYNAVLQRIIRIAAYENTFSFHQYQYRKERKLFILNCQYRE